MTVIMMIVPTIAFAGQISTTEETNFVDKIELSAAQVKEISYEDMIQNIADRTGKTTKEVSENIPNRIEQMNNLPNPLGLTRSRVNKYYTVSTQISVTAAYKPTFYAYCLGWEDKGASVMPRGLIEIQYVDLNRSYKGLSKQFSGRIYGRLEDNWTLYYDVNGDFYNNGTTSADIGGSAGIDKVAEANFSIAYASNHYKYVRDSSRINFR